MLWVRYVCFGSVPLRLLHELATIRVSPIGGHELLDAVMDGAHCVRGPNARAHNLLIVLLIVAFGDERRARAIPRGPRAKKFIGGANGITPVSKARSFHFENLLAPFLSAIALNAPVKQVRQLGASRGPRPPCHHQTLDWSPPRGGAVALFQGRLLWSR